MPTIITIPNEVQLSALLKQGVIYRITGQIPLPSVDNRPHHFIVLNNSPAREDVLVLTHGTSQVADARFFAEAGGFPTSTVVVFPGGAYRFFPRDTAIDCNQVNLMSFDQLLGVMDTGDLAIERDELSPRDLATVIQGVLDSPVIDEAIKEAIRAVE